MKLLLTAVYWEKHYIWAGTFKSWGVPEWEKVHFTDESKFNLLAQMVGSTAGGGNVRP
jgi:hypothetical protein